MAERTIYIVYDQRIPTHIPIFDKFPKGYFPLFPACTMDQSENNPKQDVYGSHLYSAQMTPSATHAYQQRLGEGFGLGSAASASEQHLSQPWSQSVFPKVNCSCYNGREL
jgi:hypothetical protein